MTVKCPWGRRWGLENKNLKGFQTKTSFAAPGHGYKFRRNANAVEMQGRGQKRVSGLISETWFFPHSIESERSLNRNRNHLGFPPSWIDPQSFPFEVHFFTFATNAEGERNKRKRTWFWFLIWRRFYQNIQKDDWRLTCVCRGKCQK